MLGDIRKTLKADGYKVHDFPTTSRMREELGLRETLNDTNWQMGTARTAARRL